jgi:hypothetical protein
MMTLLMMTLFLVPLLGIFGDFFKGIGKGFSRMFKPPTPREVLQMRQQSGAFAEEGRRLSDEFTRQYGTPLQMVAPVLSALERRMGFTIRRPPLASRRLAALEATGAMETELQRQAQALQASGFRGSGLARAMMGARLGTMMNRERIMADLAFQEHMMEEQMRQMEEQIREQAIKERFNLLMGLRSGLQEQAVKGGAITMENILQAEQLASQQMAGLMQGIGALGSAYAQYRQNQEMLRAMRGMQQGGSTSLPSVPSSPIYSF